MFKKLRNKIITINLLTTTAVLVIAFGAIYLVAVGTSNQRPPRAIGQNYSEDVSQLVNDRIAEERSESLKSLFFSLLTTGACVEIVVFLISLMLADQAIKPVKETYLAQKEFIANASHEIKTPLAVIQANLEAADIKGNRWIDNIAIKTEELAALNAQLLTLARVEAGSLEKQQEKLNLKTFVDDLVTPLKPQIEQKKAKLTIKTKDLRHPEVTVNQPALRQLLNILLDNAIKYSNKSIVVTISDRQIQVKNDGATIKKEDLPHIFDRFYQTDKTKNGVGLGLAIAKQLATANHWDLKADSNKGTTAFTLAL